MVAPRCPVFGRGDRDYPLYSAPVSNESCNFDVELSLLLQRSRNVLHVLLVLRIGLPTQVAASKVA